MLGDSRRDTFEVPVRTRVEQDGASVCYTLRNAVFEFSGERSARVDSEETLADSPPPSTFTPCPEARARIVLPPGSYEVTLTGPADVAFAGEWTESAMAPAPA